MESRKLSGVMLIAILALSVGAASAQEEDKEKLMGELERLTAYTNMRYENMVYQKKVRAAVESRHNELQKKHSKLSMEERLEAEFEAEMAMTQKSADDLVTEDERRAGGGAAAAEAAAGSAGSEGSAEAAAEAGGGGEEKRHRRSRRALSLLSRD